MQKKFFLISQVFYPDQVSTAHLYTGLCALLAKDDIEVEVWAAHPSYTESARQPEKLVYEGINIRYLPSTNFKKSSLAGRLLNMFTFMVSVSVKLMLSKEKAPVWTHTNPPFMGILVSGICSIKNRKFLYILLDIYPEGLIRLGKVSRKNPIIRIWQLLFTRSLEKCERIIVIGRDIKKYVEDICPRCKKKVKYIPHWQNDNLIFPENFKNNPFVIKNGLLNKFIIQYSGNIGLWNEVKTMGKAVKMNIGNVFYIFVGGGMRKSELTAQFSSHDQKNLIFMPFQESNEFNDILNASHVHLVTLKSGLEGISVPSKIYGILAAGKPVIALVPRNSEIAYLVEEEQCGIVVDPDDLDGFINAITLLRDNENMRILMGTNSRKAFELKYSTRIKAKEYKLLLEEVS